MSTFPHNSSRDTPPPAGGAVCGLSSLHKRKPPSKVSGSISRCAACHQGQEAPLVFAHWPRSFLKNRGCPGWGPAADARSRCRRWPWRRRPIVALGEAATARGFEPHVKDIAHPGLLQAPEEMLGRGFGEPDGEDAHGVLPANPVFPEDSRNRARAKTPSPFAPPLPPYPSGFCVPGQSAGFPRRAEGVTIGRSRNRRAGVPPPP